jgi:hypothetical protein
MRHSILCFIVLALLVPASGFAQSSVVVPGVWELAASAGPSVPTGSFADGFETGYNLGGQLGIYAAPNLGLGVGILYNRLSAKESLVLEATDSLATSADVEIWEFTAFGKYLFLPESRTRPYIKAQAGAYYTDAKVDLAEPGYFSKFDATNFGLGGGLGVQHRIPRSVGLFAEAMYVVVFTSDESTPYVSVRGGVNFYFRFRP